MPDNLIRMERHGEIVSVWIHDVDRGTIAAIQWENPHDALDWARSMVNICHRAIADDQLDHAVEPPPND